MISQPHYFKNANQNRDYEVEEEKKERYFKENENKNKKVKDKRQMIENFEFFLFQLPAYELFLVI